MASGKTHDFVTYLMLPPFFFAGVSLFDQPMASMLWLVLGAWFGGIFLSPDLDTRSRPYYRWGVFRFIWWPYQWMAKHRSSLSHGIFFAPVIRLIYLSALGALLYMFLKSGIWLSSSTNDIDFSYRQDIQTFCIRNATVFLWLGIGVWLGCLLHVILDAISSWLNALGLRPR